MKLLGHILVVVGVILLGAVACGGNSTSAETTPSVTPQNTATAVVSPTPPLPVNLTGTWESTVSNNFITPSSSGQFTLVLRQNGNAITCTATSSVAPASGSDTGCVVTANNLVPGNNQIDVRFAIRFPPYQQYDQIAVSFTANSIAPCSVCASDHRHIYGPFSMGWQTVGHLSAMGFTSDQAFQRTT